MKKDNPSFYYPVHGPWPSDESKEIRQQAVIKFNECCKTFENVVLIASSHWASEGYWIETKINKLDPTDQIVMLFKDGEIKDISK